MSDMRRAAASLVERRTERIESRHPLDESKARFEEALVRAKVPVPCPFEERWIEGEGGPVLELAYAPSKSTQRFLTLASLAFVVAIGESAWLLSTTSEGALRFLVPLATGLAVLGFPFVALALASNRDALEARVRRAAKSALQDEDEKFPAPQRWADED